jgi:hypothetical protein
MDSADECLCLLVDYTYSRKPVPGAVQWDLDGKIITESPLLREPGLVAQEDGTDRLCITFALPCSTSGEIEENTQTKYEELADDRFRTLHPGQKLT